MKSGKVQFLAVLGLGALLGFVAATGPSRVLGWFQSQSPAQAADTNGIGANEQPGCCSLGANRAELLAMADPKVKAASARIAADGKKPNIVFIMGDDVGWFNIGAYHRGIMSGKTPNLDKLATEGMLFTDYYAEASCTAGRANFITGEIPLRTGLTTVGQAGADVGLPAQACTIATALKAQGYATGQFGKNHLGDLNKYPADGARLRRILRLPVPPRRHVGPVLVLLSPRTRRSSTPMGRATWCIAGRPTRMTRRIMPRWGKIGKQKIVDEGPLRPFKNMGRPPTLAGRAPGLQVRHGDLRRGAGRKHQSLHGQGQEGRQAVLHLAQHHAHARLHVPVRASTRSR